MKKTTVLASVLAIGLMSLSAHATGRYSQETAGDGKVVVTDSVTSLQWTKDEATGKTWQAALAYCEGLSYAGHSDWRLPNKNELAGLVHYGKVSPATDFPNASNGYLWSSTSGPNSAFYAWGVRFHYGYVGPDERSYSGSVRCVRP